MTIERHTIFVCSRCKKTYEMEIARCPCEDSLFEGKTVGAFKLIEKMATQKWKVICLFCNVEAFIARENIRRQKSCGCAPRHITIRANSEEEVRYYCTRCGKHTVEELPILEWCCDEGE